MGVKAIKDVINSPVVLKYLEGMDDAVTEALKDFKSNLGAMGDFPSARVSEYRAHAARLDKTQGDFNAAWNTLEAEKVSDGKAAMVAYRNYVIALTALEADNTVYDAFVEARVAVVTAAFLGLLVDTITQARKRAAELADVLKQLDTDLKKARSQVKGAEWQRRIDAVINAGLLFTPELKVVTGLKVASGVLVTQVVIDSALGPAGASPIGMVNDAAGDYIGVIPKLSAKFVKFASIASGYYTYKLDTAEIEDAKKALLKVKDDLKNVEREIKSWQPFTVGVDKLDALRTGFNKALETAQRKADGYKSAESQRLQLLKELAAIQAQD